MEAAVERGRSIWRAGWQDEGQRQILWLILGLRLGLSLWLALIWALVDRYMPRDPAIVTSAFSRLPLSASLAGRMFLDVWMRWDAVHYLHIARFGYEGVGLGDMNFFPLYPYLVKGAAYLVGGNVIVASLLVSTLTAGVAAFLLYRWVEACFSDRTLARWVAILWLIYPTSVFLFAPFSDGLFIALAIGCLLALERRKWLLAGFLAALAGLARPQGILLGAAILAVFIQDVWQQKKPSLVRGAFGLGLAPAGWAAYMLWRGARGLSDLQGSFAQYSGVYFSNPFTTFFQAIQQAIQTGEVRLYLELLSLAGFGLVLIWMTTRKEFSSRLGMMVYAWTTLGLFLIKHSATASVYQSATRYVLSLFPVYVGIAVLFLKLPQAGKKIYLALSLAGLMLTSALYAVFIFVG